jgi:hypothetical protein
VQEKEVDAEVERSENAGDERRKNDARTDQRTYSWVRRMYDRQHRNVRVAVVMGKDAFDGLEQAIVIVVARGHFSCAAF